MRQDSGFLREHGEIQSLAFHVHQLREVLSSKHPTKGGMQAWQILDDIATSILEAHRHEQVVSVQIDVWAQMPIPGFSVDFDGNIILPLDGEE